MVRGALIQLQAFGEQDLYLTGNPQMTFWKCVYKRFSNYASEDIEQYLQSGAGFGHKTYCEFHRIGDLISDIYLQLNLPSLVSLSNRVGQEVQWLNSLGHIILKEYYLQIGEQIIDRNYSQWMEIWNELTTESGQQSGYDLMIGRIGNNSGPLRLHIPIKLWFTSNKGCALPLLALQKESVRIYFEFRTFKECITTPNIPNISEFYLQECGDIDYRLWVTYIFLEPMERKAFLNPKCGLNYLIPGLQVRTYSFVPKKEIVRFELPFTHPVSELIWTIQRSENLINNYWFNYSASIGEDGINGGETIEEAVLNFEGNDRFKPRDSFYFRIEQTYRYHTNTPAFNYIHVYSFAQYPEKLQPSGYCNMSRLDNKYLIFKLTPALIQTEKELHLNIWARTYNLLKIEQGYSELVYMN